MTAGRVTRNPSGLSELIVLFGQEVVSPEKGRISVTNKRAGDR
jgi:hypothetical protein